MMCHAAYFLILIQLRQVFANRGFASIPRRRLQVRSTSVVSKSSNCVVNLKYSHRPLAWSKASHSCSYRRVNQIPLRNGLLVLHGIHERQHCIHALQKPSKLIYISVVCLRPSHTDSSFVPRSILAISASCIWRTVRYFWMYLS